MKSALRYIFIVSTFLLSFESFASHLKGGEISVRRVSNTSLTYEFTLTTYTENNRANQEQTFVWFCFGDGTAPVRVLRCCGTPVDIPNTNGTLKNIYRTTYTYPAPSLYYKVNVAIPNRNDNVRNMSDSFNTPFYVETIFSINSGLGLNSTPVLLNPAIDITAVVGQKYTHNPNAVDAEGDSLAYRLTICRQGSEESCDLRGASVNNFRQPNEVSAIPATFEINAKTGDLVWNAPAEVGKYNCAFIVEEWRNGVKISETVRDMQIEVVDADNKAPVITVPPDICVEAGTMIRQTITATDTPSSTGRRDPLTITSTGAVYDLAYIGPPLATFVSTPKQTTTVATGAFTWQTSCNHIREQTYDILFKVEDTPPVQVGTAAKLTDSKIMKIKVVAPSVKNFKAAADPVTKGASLTWDSYACQNPGAQIVIYRKEGSCPDYTPSACQTGLPGSLGYQEIARVPVSDVKYVDTNGGKGLKKNVNYGYRLVVVFGAPTYGQSIASAGACLMIESPIILMTNVTVDKTDVTNGEITVKWTRPIGLDKNIYSGPYQYRLSRATGLNGTNFTQISGNIDTDLSGTKADTVLTDKALNTTDNAYRYRVEFFYTNNGSLVSLDTSSSASSVRLGAAADIRSVNLSWQANVPWNNQNQTHKVYRETRPGSGIFNQIADVPVTGTNTFNFKDSGADNIASDGVYKVTMSPDSSYCYKVQTVGNYSDPKQNLGLLFNLSQIICATPKSNIVPCPPVLSIDLLDCKTFSQSGPCDQTSFANVLTWTTPAKDANGVDCTKDIVKYTIFYSAKSDGNFEKIGEITSPQPLPQTFTHTKSDSYIGCYYITATDKYGAESAKSNVVCKDNCPNFELPNIFTPNGDSKNDTFQPLICPRFVDNVKFDVYNRNGTKVYEYNGGIKGFAWDGKTNDGKEVSSGTYYYSCEVKFLTLDPSKTSLSLKGWVELLR